MILPPCIHRGEIDGKRCVCRSPNVHAAGTVPLTLCVICPQRRGEGEPTVIAERPAEAAIPCIHRGPELRRMEGTLCGLKGSLFPVHQCGEFGECTLTRICPKSTIQAVCATCEKGL